MDRDGRTRDGCSGQTTRTKAVRTRTLRVNSEEGLSVSSSVLHTGSSSFSIEPPKSDITWRSLP
jgi:hypothetical protein